MVLLGVCVVRVLVLLPMRLEIGVLLLLGLLFDLDFLFIGFLGLCCLLWLGKWLWRGGGAYFERSLRVCCARLL